MQFEQLFFFAFATVLVGASLLVIFVRNPVHAVLFLILAFFASAGLWLLLEAEFLALILILVYVGAVMTLFLFVVMMLNLDIAPQQAKLVRYLPLGIVFIALILAYIVYAMGPQNFWIAQASDVNPAPATYSNITELGKILYTDYIYPFELAAILLLTAIIAAISLTLRPPRAKTQNISNQLHVKPEERVKLVKMKSEK